MPDELPSSPLQNDTQFSRPTTVSHSQFSKVSRDRDAHGRQTAELDCR